MLMITFSKLGSYGRTGNVMFQVAAMFGFAEKYGVELSLPEWKNEAYFPNLPDFTGPIQGKEIKEHAFHYTPDFFDSLDWGKEMDFLGYFQSEKYFPSNVRELFAFHPDLITATRKQFEKAFEKETIAIHVRRGDYVSNPNYVQLPPTYYILALETHFPEYRDCNLIFFSDDPDYCKLHFQCLPNAFFSDNFIDIADLCLMSQCDNFIIANSSFSFWGAWLGEKKGTKVVRTAHHFAGKLANNSISDLYPERWIEFDHEGKRIDLRDVTFTIPVSYDHSDRKENLELCLAFLLTHFDTNIVVGEQGGKHFEYLKQYCQYRHFEGMQNFHRTKMLNDMARDATTPFIANYDCDVLFAPMQILEAVHRLRNGCDVVYPYDGQFARVDRNEYHKLSQNIDIGTLSGKKLTGLGKFDSVGGAVFFNRESFFEGGGENEGFVSFGPEDSERFFRFSHLGYKVERVPGALYHVNHFVGENSSSRNKFFNANHALWDKIKQMSKAQLQKHVLGWAWTKSKHESKSA